MTDAPYRNSINAYERVEHDVVEPMIDWLCGGRSLEVLDAGCGFGGPALVFAASGCRVVGIDLEKDRIAGARAMFAENGYASHADFIEADMTALPFDDESFDLVWSSRALHHVPDRLRAVRELARVLRPGSRLAIREDGLPIQILPFDIGVGQVGLQARLAAANERWFAAMCRATMPDAIHYPYGWLQLALDADLVDATARTFTHDFVPPFNADQKSFILHHLEVMLARDSGEYGPLLEEDDRQALSALVDPAGSHYILNRADLHVRYGLSVYVGRKPATGQGSCER